MKTVTPLECRKLSPEELADPEYIQAYIDAMQESFAEVLNALNLSRQTQTIREVRNKLTIDGHLNAALDEIMACPSPDGIFCILGTLADKTIELSYQARLSK